MALTHMAESGVIGRTDLFSVDPRKIQVRDGWNPRRNFALDDLKASIKANGVRRPLVVRRLPDYQLELVDGERRLRSVLELLDEGCEIRSVPCMIVDRLRAQSDAELLVDTIVANDAKPFELEEEADAFRRLRDWGWDVAHIATRVGRSQTYVYNRLQMLAAAPAVLEATRNGDVPQAVALEIVRTASTPEAQTDALHVAITERATKHTRARQARTMRQEQRTEEVGNTSSVLSLEARQVYRLTDRIGIGAILEYLVQYCRDTSCEDLAEKLSALVAPQDERQASDDEDM